MMSRMRTFYVVKNLTYKYNICGILYACVQQNQQFSFQGRIRGLKLEGTQVLGRGSGGRVESPS